MIVELPLTHRQAGRVVCAFDMQWMHTHTVLLEDAWGTEDSFFYCLGAESRAVLTTHEDITRVWQ